MLLRVLAQIFKNPMNHRQLLIWLFIFVCIVLKADTCSVLCLNNIFFKKKMFFLNNILKKKNG